MLHPRCIRHNIEEEIEIARIIKERRRREGLDRNYNGIICQVHSSGTHISMVHFLPTIKACLP